MTATTIYTIVLKLIIGALLYERHLIKKTNRALQKYIQQTAIETNALRLQMATFAKLVEEHFPQH